MTHVITSLCLRESGCMDVCPVECITPGSPVEDWPTYYIDPGTCIDCGACVPECPYSAIFHEDDVPAAFQAKGGELINRRDLTGHYASAGRRGEAISLQSTRVLSAGEVLDLRESIGLNKAFHH